MVLVRKDVREKDEDNFKESGPVRLAQTKIDWGKDEHRRCITASLVKGTYVLQADRTKNKRRDNTSKALAPAWWEAFHFRKLHEYKLGRSIIYGAAFEYTPANGAPRHPSAPTHIVAFRGTGPTLLSDLLDDFGILINKQRLHRRFVDARTNVQRLLGEKAAAAAADDDDDDGRSGETIWLAGHSLGAAVALYVGREMMTRNGRKLPAFLFNPPHPSVKPLVHAVLSEKAKRDLHIFSHLVKGVLGEILWLRPHREHMEELFQQLSHWVPSLYVHREDVICSGFIDYFEQREQEAEKWSTCVANSSAAAATLLYRDALFRWHPKQSNWPQLLPCAVLWTNSHGDDPHGLQQWWRSTSGPNPELHLRRNEYSWDGL